MNRFVFFILLLVLIVSGILALRVGSGRISWSEFLPALIHPRDTGPTQMIIWLHRFPRVIAALLIGAGLAVSGCVLQGLLRNPLAEPYTLGISGGAALGAALVTIVRPTMVAYWTLPLAAFLGALLAVALVYLIAARQYFSIIGLVLAGLILSFVFSSSVLLIFALANPLQVYTTLFWLIGDLSGDKGELITVIPFFIIPGITVMFLLGRDLDAMSLGDEKAFFLGVRARGARRLFFMLTSLVVGACIATAGMISFVGLVIPHLMRLIIGPRHRPLILASMLSGASFLVICDTLARTVLCRYGQELPVGVITGLVGGVFLITLLLRKRPSM